MAHQTVSLSELRWITELNLRCSQPQAQLILGAPGTAKSAFVEHVLPGIVAKVHGFTEDDVHYEEFRVTGKDAVEFAGVALPIKTEDGQLVTQYTKPPLLVVLEQLCAEYKFVIVNFDELVQANVDVFNVLSDVVNAEARRINGWQLPDNVFFAGTGNRMQDKAAAKRMPAHITDRMLIVELERDVDGWARNYADGNVHPLIVACAKAYQHEAGFFADAVPVEDTSYCTLRSLTQISRQFEAYLDDLDFDGTIPPLLEKMFAATVGAQAASTIVGYLAQADKVPTAEEVLADPEGAVVPEETGFQALAGNVAISAAEDADSGEKVLRYLVRLRPDLQISLATKLLKRSARYGWYVSGPVAQEFIVKFNDLMPLVETAGWTH